MSIKNKKIAIKLIGIGAIVVLLIGIFSQIVDHTKWKLWLAAIANGLDGVRVISQESDVWNTYTIQSNNFEDLAFEDMLRIKENLDTCAAFNLRLEFSCNGNIYTCDTSSKIIKKNGSEIYNDYENSEKYKDEMGQQKERQSYTNEYPYIGMREEFLSYTKLGRPNKIEESKDFEHLRSNRRYRTYIWYETKEHGKWEVTVGYAEYIAGYGYKNYPIHNGIVEYITYNEKGKSPVTIY